MNKELIEALKKNEKPFGKMTAEMKEAMFEIGIPHFQRYMYLNAWHGNLNSFASELTYRLRPDYEMEPEIMENVVFKVGKKLMTNITFNKRTTLSEAVDHPDFIGFRYGTGIILPYPVCYDVDGESTYQDSVHPDEAEYKVIHATHVLFKRSK